MTSTLGTANARHRCAARAATALATLLAGAAILAAPALATDPVTTKPLATRPALQVEIAPPPPVIVRPQRPPSRSNAEPSSPIHDYLGSPNARGGAPAGPLVSPPR